MYPFTLLNNPPAPVYPQYPAVVALARKLTPPFVDPANLYPERPVAERRGGDWCTAVLGRPVDLATTLTIHEQYLLIAADQLEVDPPLPEWIVEGRRLSAERQRQRDEARQAMIQRDRDRWTQALATAAVEVDVHLGSRARAWTTDGGSIGHVVPRADVVSGKRRLRTHPAGRALCETPGRARPLAIGDTPEPVTTPATCVNCLKWLPQVRAAVTL